MMDVNMSDISTLVGSLGFPIVVTWFLLTKGTAVVKEITGAVNEMKGAVILLTARLEAVEKERIVAENK